MGAGIAEENGADQDITFEVQPGEVFVVPQGLPHFNHNSRCTPTLFTQTFSSADAGSINVVGVLAALRDGSAAGAAAISASGAENVTASDMGSFRLDAACLARCGLPATGAPGDGLRRLPQSVRNMLGLTPITDDGHAGASAIYMHGGIAAQPPSGAGNPMRPSQRAVQSFVEDSLDFR